MNNKKIIYAFNIFTGKLISASTYKEIAEKTQSCYNTITKLLKEGRPLYTTGWLFSWVKKKIWIQLDDIHSYKYKKEAYRNILYSRKYYRMAITK